MYARVALDFSNQSPVGIACVHLTAGTPMNGQRLDAAILQLLSQLRDNQLFEVPA